MNSAAAPVYSQIRVDITLVDDPEIQTLNRDYRARDRPTDVLSFPVWEGEVFASDPDELALGDIVISLPTAVRQAGEQRHSLAQELSFLVVHGTLHLLGYDHVSAAPRRRMWRWQDAAFQEATARMK